MKLSETIKYFQSLQAEIGDVDLFVEDNDGRCTCSMPFKPKVTHRVIWKGHSAPPRYYVDNAL